MATSSTPIELLAAVALDYEATAVAQQSESARFQVLVRSADGKVWDFCIEARILIGAQVLASEAVPRLLPKACPPRHINPNGSFCLSWHPDVDLAVVDEESARAWWTQLLVFLRLQQRAERQKVWRGDEWAHGGAAEHQRTAEEAAKRLGLSEALAGRELVATTLVRRSKRGERIVVLLNRGAEVCSYWGDPLRVINRRRRCICPRGDIKRHRRLRSCAKHADDALDLANSLLQWRVDEAAFWRKLTSQGQTCCGTMKECGLKLPDPPNVRTDG